MKIPVSQIVGLSANDIPLLNSIVSKLTNAVNNIEFGNLDSNENIWCTFIVVEACCADECASATHSLRRKPLGTIVVWQDAAASLYKPTDVVSADTSNAIFYTFDTDVPSAVLLLI